MILIIIIICIYSKSDSEASKYYVAEKEFTQQRELYKVNKELDKYRNESKFTHYHILNS